VVAFKDLWYRHPANNSIQYPCIAPHALTSMEGKQIAQGFPVFGNQCSIRMVGTEASHFYKKLFGRTGIIYIQDYWKRHGETTPTGDHIDVWNGYRSSTKWLMEWFSWLGYYSNYVQAREVWFWDVK
jgi:Type VI secretion system (T6SS), amidase effector protein 4